MNANSPHVIRGLMGVAISTTGDEHRMPMLDACIDGWRKHLPLGSVIAVTVDGDDAALARANACLRLKDRPGIVFRVGQPVSGNTYEGRVGVAANKNTGLELLMTHSYCDHLWLSDDDMWPTSSHAITDNLDLKLPHSMVNWGGWYLRGTEWIRGRGSALYVHADGLSRVGGMIEEFSTGGHEHVEWARRFFQAGLTPVLYPAPRKHAEVHGMGAAGYWHSEDMPKPGEDLRVLRARRDRVTSMKRKPEDQARAEQIMVERDGNTEYVSYLARDNGRESATLYHNTGA